MTSKIELINRLQSPENRLVLPAVEELRNCKKLTDGSLRGIALCQAQLQDADLCGADLAFVDFHQASLDHANLEHANLQAATMNRASLQGANLNQADLTNASLYKVNLRGALNVSEQQLASTNQLFGATMPDGNVYNGRFNLFGDLARARWAKVNVNDPKSMAEFYGITLEAYLAGQKKEALAYS